MGIRRASVFDYKDQMSDLLQQHWEEVALNKDIMILAPDWDRYRLLEQAGKVLSLFAVEEGNRLVGYSVNVIDYHLHYSGLKVCQNDVLFVDPTQRGTTGLRLIQETEAAARSADARLMLWHAKPDSALDCILRRRRYLIQDIIYSLPL